MHLCQITPPISPEQRPERSDPFETGPTNTYLYLGDVPDSVAAAAQLALARAGLHADVVKVNAPPELYESFQTTN